MSFAIDTGDSGGSQGPWISWSSNGSPEKGFPPRSWVLRDRDDSGDKIEDVVPGFINGCVLDLDSLKIGWERDAGLRQAPERRWNPTVSQATPRPDESRKASGSHAWSRALSVRCAIGGGRAATWEQGSFAAYEAFAKVAKQISAQHPGDNTLPVIKQVGVEKRDLPNGSANIPILEVVKWVPRPECLKEGAPVIDTGDFGTPAPKQQAAPPKQQVKAAEPEPADSDEF